MFGSSIDHKRKEVTESSSLKSPDNLGARVANPSLENDLLSQSTFTRSIPDNHTSVGDLTKQLGETPSPGIVTRTLNAARDFVSGTLDAIGTWSATLADGAGKTLLVLSDYASKSISKVTQNIATPETNQALAETIETVTPAIGYGVGKTVGSTVSGLASGLKGLLGKN